MQDRKRKFLVCLSGAPSNAGIICAAARMADASDAELSALFVETPQFEQLDAQSKARLRENTNLAQSLGARIEIVYGDDIPFQIAEYARLSGIDLVVIGQSQITRGGLFPKPGLTDVLARQIPDIELHIIPDGTVKGRYTSPERERITLADALKNIAVCALILAAATGMGTVFDRLGFTNSNIIMTYLLGVLLIAIVTTHRGYSLVSSVIAVFAFNYFFVEPRMSLNAYEAGYPVTFGVMFVTAFITGTLTIRLKKNARQSAQLAYRTKIISDTDQMLAKAGDKESILSVCKKQVGKLLDHPLSVIDTGETDPAARDDGEIIAWVLENRSSAGCGREKFETAESVYFPILVQDRCYGVLAVETASKPLSPSETSVLLSILGECALALESEQNRREKEQTALRMQNERLRSNLLRSVSHDLRTPLTSISGNASNLLSGSDKFDRETLRTLYRDIYDDSKWLISLVENLLASTRIEDGSVRLRLKTELADELMSEAVSHVRPEDAGRRVDIVPNDELLAVNADAGLVVQVLVNLIGNAVKYSPTEARIWLRVENEGAFVRFFVANEGSHIPEDEKKKLFEMFYVGSKTLSDGRRGLGLGLALCRSIVEAHGGSIAVSDLTPDGTEFSFTLPTAEVLSYDE